MLLSTRLLIAFIIISMCVAHLISLVLSIKISLFIPTTSPKENFDNEIIGEPGIELVFLYFLGLVLRYYKFLQWQL